MTVGLELFQEPWLAASVLLIHVAFGMSVVYTAYAGFERNPAAGVVAALLLTTTILAGEWVLGKWFISLFTDPGWPVLRETLTAAAIGSSIGASLFALA